MFEKIGDTVRYSKRIQMKIKKKCKNEKRLDTFVCKNRK